MKKPPTSRLRKWTFRLLALVLGPLLFFGLIELILVVSGTGRPTEFLISDPEDETRWRDNHHFSRRFFPEAMARNSQPLSISKEKPESTLRIVLFGGSAAMGDPNPAFGPARILEVLLEARHPGREFEVINSGVTAINSHVVREIAHDLTKLDADAWVVYMGNNEVYGPFGAGTVFSSQAPPLWVTRLGLWFQSTKTGQLAHDLLASDGNSDKKSWRGMEMFLDQQVKPGDPSLRQVYENYAGNLRAIIDEGHDSGARVLVSSVAVNLRDSPPFSAGDATAANLFAEAQFSEARDADTLRFRADSTINRLAREIAEETGAVFVDAEAELAGDGPPGSDLFVDHVHLTFRGSYRLARLLASGLTAELGLEAATTDWLEPDECARRLGFTPLHRVQILMEMRQRLANPPFSAQPNAEERDRRMASEIQSLQKRMTPDLAAESIANYQQLVADRPDDWQLRKEFAILLGSVGRHAEASQQLSLAAGRYPHRPEMWFRLASSKMREKDWPGAENALQRSLAVDPDFHQAHHALGLCASQQGSFDKAYRHFAHAVEIKPDFTTAWIRWGLVLASQGKKEDSAAKFRAALDASPDSVAAHQHLVKHYLEAQELSKAEHHCRKALELAPKKPLNHVDLGIILLKQEKREEAIACFQAALAIDPENALALAYLRRLQP